LSRQNKSLYLNIVLLAAGQQEVPGKEATLLTLHPLHPSFGKKNKTCTIDCTIEATTSSQDLTQSNKNQILKFLGMIPSLLRY
jgi:hypothetical protein